MIYFGIEGYHISNAQAIWSVKIIVLFFYFAKGLASFLLYAV